MNTIRFNHQIKIIAHRGVSGLERENTCASFIAAGNRSYYGIETDVHVTKDGKFIVFHDDTTDRLLGIHHVIEETDYETLRSLRLTDLDGTRRGDLVLPSLEEYIRVCKKYGKECVLELKNHFEMKHIREIISIIRSEDWLDHTTFISFDLANCICVRQCLPDQRIQYLVQEVTEEIISQLVQYGFALDADYRTITRERVAACRKAGIAVNVWTVNTVETAEKMLEFGVDYITTNILE